jgi:histidine triad (HIT) family protein
VTDDCVFCRIVSGELPADVVLKTDGTVAFRDLNPQAPTHVLVIPREHIVNASTVEAGHGEHLAEMLTTARQVAEQEGILDGGYRLVFNVGDDAGNTVPHLHLHVIGGRSMAWPPG